MAGAQDGTFTCLGYIEGTERSRIRWRVVWLRTYTVYVSDTDAAAQTDVPPQT
jgi:hypothetical protein